MGVVKVLVLLELRLEFNHQLHVGWSHCDVVPRGRGVVVGGGRFFLKILLVAAQIRYHGVLIIGHLIGFLSTIYRVISTCKLILV